MALDCSICIKEYLHNEESSPRVLLCGHTFCNPCIFTLKKNSKVTCPMCRIESDFDKITINYIVIQLIEEKKEEKKKIVRGCSF